MNGSATKSVAASELARADMPMNHCLRFKP
jgi:hypothetical protein